MSFYPLLWNLFQFTGWCWRWKQFYHYKRRRYERAKVTLFSVSIQPRLSKVDIGVDAKLGTTRQYWKYNMKKTLLYVQTSILEFSNFDDFANAGDSNQNQIYSVQPGSSVNLTCLSEGPHGWTSTAPQFRQSLDKAPIVGLFYCFLRYSSVFFYYYRRYMKTFRRWRSFWTYFQITILATFTTTLACGSRMHLTCNQRDFVAMKEMQKHFIYLLLCHDIAGMWENTLVIQLWIYLKKAKKKMGSMQPAYSICMSMTASIHLRFLWKRDRILSDTMKILSKSFLYWFPADHPIPISKWRCPKKTINTLRGLYPTSTILDWDLYSPCNTYID